MSHPTSAAYNAVPVIWVRCTTCKRAVRPAVDAPVMVTRECGIVRKGVACKGHLANAGTPMDRSIEANPEDGLDYSGHKKLPKAIQGAAGHDHNVAARKTRFNKLFLEAK